MEQKQKARLKLKNSNFVVRLTSAVVLIFLVACYLSLSILSNEFWAQKHDKLLSCIFGGIFILITLAVLVVCFYELTKALQISQWQFKVIYCLVGLALFLTPIGSKSMLQESIFIYSYQWILKGPFMTWYFELLVCLSLLGIILLMLKVYNIDKQQSLILISIGFLIVFALKGFTHISLATNYGLEGYESIKFGYMTSIWIWTTIILTDSFAYIFGVSFGKNKMAPKISPNKSWEGAIGGFAVATSISVLIALMFYFFSPDHILLSDYILEANKSVSIILYILFAILISIVCQLGDLLFSYIKRVIEIKDFSNLIPGHGGLLDRMDSFMVVFFIMYLFTLIS